MAINFGLNHLYLHDGEQKKEMVVVSIAYEAVMVSVPVSYGG